MPAIRIHDQIEELKDNEQMEEQHVQEAAPHEEKDQPAVHDHQPLIEIVHQGVNELEQDQDVVAAGADDGANDVQAELQVQDQLDDDEVSVDLTELMQSAQDDEPPEQLLTKRSGINGR